MMAGYHESIEKYKQFLSSKAEFNNLFYKESLSSSYPFSKLIVRIKQEIIMYCPSPEILSQWYEKTRNDRS